MRIEALAIDLEHLLKLRLVVARQGEMDRAKWWNTRGQLGPYGTAALRRGFPRTHSFAQARSVFAVAAHRCAQVFDDPRSVTLWRLLEVIEEDFDARWEHWLDHGEEWTDFFAKLETPKEESLLEVLGAFDLVSPESAQAVPRLKRSAGVPAVALPGVFQNDNATVTLLALGFARGGQGDLVVPYVRRED